MRHVRYLHPFVAMTLFVSLVGAKFYRPHQYNVYKAGPVQHHGKPTGRHKNHCAYVVEKTVSFTTQDGTAPYVKAEYNKCSWGQKCPALLYRLMYKPIFKVAHKTLTELEWRCCPGFSGYGCMEGPAAYHHPVRMMPPFKGPPFKGPQFKGPQFKGPQYKGPMFKGPPMKANPWSQPKGPPAGGIHSYHMRHFDSSMTPSYPEASYGPYPSGPETMPDHQDPHHTDPDQESHQESDQEPHLESHQESHLESHLEPHLESHQESHLESHQESHLESHQESDLESHLDSHLESHQEHGNEDQHGHVPEQHVLVETAPPHGGEEVEGQVLNSETVERLEQMEEDIRRLNQGLETLRGTLNGLEDGLRTSLREDANRMLSALLSAGPSPVSAPALASTHSAVGFGDIPGGDPELEGVDGRHIFPSTGDLSGRIEELRAELQSKNTELQELRTTVMSHDGALKKLSEGQVVGSDSIAALVSDNQKAAESLVDAKLSGARAEILGGFEKRVTSTEGRCDEKVGEVRHQCQSEHSERQQHIQQVLEDSASSLKREMGNLQAQVHGLESTESCCDRMPGLAERMKMLELSVAGLNQSQGNLSIELGGHRDHIEGMLEGRLGYVEAKLNLTGETRPVEMAGRGHDPEVAQRLEDRLEKKLKALEGRLLIAVEELGNATAPALLEGHAVPALETELESFRRRLEMDLDRVQKHLGSLELRCSSSGTSPPTPSVIQGDASVSTADPVTEESVKVMLVLQAERLNRLNTTLESLLNHPAFRDQQEGAAGDSLIQGELTFLKFNIRSVNHTLNSLQGSVGTVVHQVDLANSTWHEREKRLAQQMKGMVQLVGRQASMLGAGERRLTRLKGELQEMKRRLAGELQGCRSTALGVRKEVTEVEGRVASVEDQCKGLNHMAEDLERIREELERQSDGLLSQVNGTLSSHAQQLSELRGELKNCTSKVGTTQQSMEVDPAQTRGDTFTLI